MFEICHNTLVDDPLASLTEADAADWAARQQRLFAGIAATDTAGAWSRRAFPVMAVLAPAVSTAKNKVEFPGDPMCLYHALTKVVDDVVTAARKGPGADRPFNDFCPFWDEYPTLEYRRKASVNGIRSRSDLNANKTDGCVFDPRIWNRNVEQYFRRLLRDLRPRIVLVSTVSPAYRYAAVILRVVREELPGAITILGGRHVDATTIVDDVNQVTRLSESNPLEEVRRNPGKYPPYIDIMIAGQAYYSLSAVLQAVSLAIPIGGELGFPDRSRIARRLRQVLPLAAIRGASTVVLATETEFQAFRLLGPPVDFRQLPSPYAAFAIRAQFPIFPSNAGRPKRTGHINTGIPCPYTCEFCSESRALHDSGAAVTSDVDFAFHEMTRLVEFGAEAVFFDDSILFAGAKQKILRFCHRYSEWIEQGGKGVEWGAQLTISVVEALLDSDAHNIVLQAMKKAGCTYIYFGLESLSEPIMERISKTGRSSDLPWPERVRRALMVVRDAGIRAGASVLFGLEGETMTTINETISRVESLLQDGLLSIVSPNLMTYHPNTAITNRHDRENRLGLEHASLGDFVREPYSFFEEAFPGMVSRDLSEEMIWHIHRETMRRWGERRNGDTMRDVSFPDVEG